MSRLRLSTRRALVQFGLALLVAALLSAPWQALWQTSVVLGLVGLGGVSYVIIVLRQRNYDSSLNLVFAKASGIRHV